MTLVPGLPQRSSGIMLQVRNLTADDAEMVKNLRLFCMRESPSRFSSSLQEEQERTVDSLKTSLSKSREEFFIVGAFDQDKLVAMAGFTRERAEKASHKGSIWGVYVMPDYRGQRHARQLMKKLIDQAKELDGLNTLLLKVTGDAISAKQMYSELGFKSYGCEVDSLRADGKSIDEELMRLELSSE